MTSPPAATTDDGAKNTNNIDSSSSFSSASSLTASSLERAITDRDYDFVKKSGGPSGIASRLEREEKEEREAKYGKNEFEYPPPKTFFELCVIALEDFTVRILIAAAVVSLAIGAGMKEHRDEYGYLEGIAIVVVVMVVVFLQAYIDFAKEKKFRQLNSVKDNYNVKKVEEGGEVKQIPAGEVLVGDVLELTAGDKIPADCVYLEGSKLKTNEAAMTGEPIDISKSLEKDPFLLSGTSVSEGSGRCVVVAVGGHSQWGAILKTLIVEPQSTPLQERLDALVVKVGNFGILAAVLTFLASFIRWIAESAESGSWDGLKVLDFLINSVTIVVVAIPEGLPLAITLGLAFAMKQMMKDQNLVRRLEACETMGSATQLNADKTGTLTQNRMTVTEAWLGRIFFENMDKETLRTISKSFQEILSESCAINSDANLSHKVGGGVEHIGSKTECALLQMVEDFGGEGGGANDRFRYHQLRDSKPVKQRYHFTSARKRMSTAISGSTSGTTRLHVKGASEVLVELCSKIAKPDGSVDSFSKEDKKNANDAIQRMAERGLRTLAIAYVDLNIDPSKLDPEKPQEENLTLLGIVGIKDPIRVETAEAVRLLRGAGVTVRMVTGDNAVTARAIAIEAGIFDPSEEEKGATILEGPVFRKMSRAEQESVAMKIRVLARSSPTDKLVLCNLQRELGEVVSVTGDGTNDAPALKDADVGFALGIAGTEIAKEACDIVIMDDNIKSMAKAVLWGRNVYQSIRKFLQFQLVVNVVAVSLNLIAACAGIEELPLGAVPLLWVNMIMDSMGALALATEPPSDRLMERQPFGRTAPLVNKQMWRNIIGVSTYQLIVCITLMFAGTSIMGMDCPIIDGVEDCHHRTLELNGFIFNAFVFMQVFSEINSRRIGDFNVFEDIHKSGLFCVIILFTVGVQVLFIEVVGSTVVGPAIGFVNLTTKEWITSIVLGVVILPVGALTRCLPLSLFPGVTDEEAMAQAAEEAHKAQVAAKALADREKVGGSGLSDAQPSASPARERRVSVDLVSSSISHAFEAASEAVIASRRASHNEDRSRISPSLSRESSFGRQRPSFRRAATMVISANRFRLPMDTIRDSDKEEHDEENR